MHCNIPSPPPVTLTWSGLNYTVGKKQKKKQLLHNLSGYAKPQTMTALMGPSGAGKTTFLDVLAGRKSTGVVTGDVCVNGHPKEQATFCRMSGYVEQSDALSPKITVRESLEFSGTLRLPRTIAVDDRRGLVDRMIEVLQLMDVPHERLKDVSRDVRKRVSIGMELMANPSIVFLDEPTTGLDASGAQVVLLNPPYALSIYPQRDTTRGFGNEVFLSLRTA